MALLELRRLEDLSRDAEARRAAEAASARNASVGRFFPNQCFVQVDDTRKAIVMSASGTGYATLPVARRVGFYVGMTVEYVPDFRLESDATYVWGRFSRFVSPPDMRIVGVENPVVNLATRTPAGDVATAIGNGLVASEIGRGFTVVRQDDGDDFALGHLEPPQKPTRQFKSGADRVVLESDLTEVHTQSRDYLGPFEVHEQGAALFFHAKVDGAPLVFAHRRALRWRDMAPCLRRRAAHRRTAGPARRAGNPRHWRGEPPLPAPAGHVLRRDREPGRSAVRAAGRPLPVPEQVGYVSYSIELGDLN